MRLSLFNPKKGTLIYSPIENKFLIESIKNANINNENEDLIELFVSYFKSNLKTINNLAKLELEKSPFDNEIGLIIENMCCFYFEDYLNRIEEKNLKDYTFDTLILERKLKEKYNNHLDNNRLKLFKECLYEKKDKHYNRLFEYVILNTILNVEWKQFFNKDVDINKFNNMLNNIKWLRNKIASNYEKILKTMESYYKELKKIGIDFNGISNYNGFYHQRQFQMDYVSTNFDLILDVKNYSSSSLSKTENIKQLFWNYHILLNIKK